MQSSVTRYDPGNATIESLSWYESKYAGELVPPVFLASGRLVNLALRAYGLLAF